MPYRSQPGRHRRRSLRAFSWIVPYSYLMFSTRSLHLLLFYHIRSSRAFLFPILAQLVHLPPEPPRVAQRIAVEHRISLPAADDLDYNGALVDGVKHYQDRHPRQIASGPIDQGAAPRRMRGRSRRLRRAFRQTLCSLERSSTDADKQDSSCKSPLDVFFEYRKQFQVPLKLKKISCAGIAANRVLMDPAERRLSSVDIKPQSILALLGISSALTRFHHPRNHLDWAMRCPRFSSTPVLLPPAH